MLGAISVPADVALENGAFTCTAVALTIAVTKRISPLHDTPWPTTSPCAAANTSDVPLEPVAVSPPVYTVGMAPMLAWKSGP